MSYGFCPLNAETDDVQKNARFKAEQENKKSQEIVCPAFYNKNSC